ELAYQEALDERRSAELALEQRRLTGSSSADSLASELVTLASELRALADEQSARRARQVELTRRLECTRVVASRSGSWIGAAPEDLLGRRVAEGEELGRLAAGRPRRFRGRIDDLGRAHVEGPLPVRVRVDGYPWLLHGSVSGRLTRIDDVAAGASGFEVEVTLEPPFERAQVELFEGMRAEGRILVEERVSLVRLLFERLLEVEEP
ncbi:MAG TPA: hypothetical protein VMT18_11035, partial [Planctomycetota bacterium]|nr:hypothetical protein [Planctomycetota bacterium]